MDVFRKKKAKPPSPTAAAAAAAAGSGPLSFRRLLGRSASGGASSGGSNPPPPASSSSSSTTTTHTDAAATTEFWGAAPAVYRPETPSLAELAALRDGPGSLIHGAIEAAVRARPDAVAVSFHDGPSSSASLTYRELDARASAVAQVLRQAVAGSPAAPAGGETLVAVRVQRSLGLAVALYGVLKAGMAYVPVDPTHPPDRQQYMVEDSGARVVITDEEMAEPAAASTNTDAAAILRISAGGDVVSCPSASSASQPPPAAAAPAAATEVPPPAGGPSRVGRLAYVLYTSGSTGKPKGVQIEHGSVLVLLECWRRTVLCAPAFPPLSNNSSSSNNNDADEQDAPIPLIEHRVLGLTTCCFDLSVVETFLPLVLGARLCLVSSAVQRDPPTLMRLIEELGITYMQATPATLEMMTRAFQWRPPGRLTILCGGEAYRPTLLPLAQTARAVFNGYGPTESTVWATVFRIPRQEDYAGMGKIPIGLPVWGTEAHVLQLEGTEAAPAAAAATATPPAGASAAEKEEEEGELYLGGLGLARGYHGRPALTAERFVSNPDPASSDRCPRLYKTGDVVKWATVEGRRQLLYLGRTDHQVKFRGFRIELGEIEEAVRRQDPARILSAVVIARDDVPNGMDNRALVAYLLPAGLSQGQENSSSSSSSSIHSSAAGAASIDLTVVRQGLLKQLPAYMVPRHFVVMDGPFPLNPSGKVDRAALPHPTKLSASSTSTSKPAAAAAAVTVTSPAPIPTTAAAAIRGITSSPPAPAAAAAATAAASLRSEVKQRWLPQSQSPPPSQQQPTGGVSTSFYAAGAVRSSGMGSRQRVLALLQEVVLSITGTPVQPDSSLEAVGLDSLNLVFLVRRLTDRLAEEMPSSSSSSSLPSVGDFYLLLQQSPTLAALADQLVARLGLSTEDKDEEAAAAAAAAAEEEGASAVIHHTSGSSSVGSSKASKAVAAATTTAASGSLGRCLTGIRGFLIAWVYIEHFMPPAARREAGRRFGMNTHIFAMLSGFALAMQMAGPAPASSSSSEGSSTNNTQQPHRSYSIAALRAFLSLRAIGLFPFYWLAALAHLPRYIFKQGGVYHPRRILEDWGLVLMGGQAWYQDRNDRSFPELYYGSVQWAIYALVACLLFLGWGRPVTSLARLADGRGKGNGKGRSSSATTTSLETTLFVFTGLGLLTLPLVGRYLALSPHWYQERKAHPLLYLPYALMGVAAADVLRAVEASRLLERVLPLLLSTAGSETGATAAATAAAPVGSSSSPWAVSSPARLWQHLPDILVVLMALLILGPSGAGVGFFEGKEVANLDTSLTWCILPVLACLALLALAMQQHTQQQSSPHHLSLLHRVACLEPLVALGRLTLPLYFLHQILCDFYVCLAVEDLYRQWDSWVLDLDVDEEMWRYVAYGGWMAQQTPALKLVCFAACVLLCWLLQQYYQEGLVLWLVERWQQRRPSHKQQQHLPSLLHAAGACLRSLASSQQQQQQQHPLALSLLKQRRRLLLRLRQALAWARSAAAAAASVTAAAAAAHGVTGKGKGAQGYEPVPAAAAWGRERDEEEGYTVLVTMNDDE